MAKILSRSTVILLFCVLAFVGCDRRDEPQAPPSLPAPPEKIKVALQVPVEPAVYELPSQALATWREYAAYRPALVLFSTHPLLDPIPLERKEPIAQLLHVGTDKELMQRSRLLCADPAILPPETVSAAIDQGFFSEIVVVLPTNKKPEEVDLDGFCQRSLNAGFITKVEAKGFTLADGTITGSVRGVPLRIAHPDKLPRISGPVILHVDLGFFKGMYVNEVKTPAYDQLYQVASDIRAASYQTLATSLSFSNQEVEFSLESRFLIRDLAAILRNPQYLDGGTPASWTLRAQALYAASMFGESRSRELTAQSVKTTPDDAAAHYALALNLFGQNRAKEGFASLDRAVALDSGYALEYVSLAKRGVEMGRIGKAVELLGKATKAFPDSPFIHLQLANYLLQAGRNKEAQPIIAELRSLTWSPVFYAEIPALLKRMDVTAAREDFVPRPTAKPPAEDIPAKPAGRMPGFNHMGMGAERH